MINKIHHTNVLDGLKKLNSNSIDCIVTSPPYWALRDYGVKGQLGLEPNPDDYIQAIFDIIKECERVLKPTGTLWLNLGDSYYTKNNKRKEFFNRYGKDKQSYGFNWLQAKQRLLIPFRIAIKIQDELGMILRNDITWVKQWCNVKTKASAGGSMPSAVTDRLNTVSESLFLFVKKKKYYFNMDSIRVPHKTSSLKRAKYSPQMCNIKGKNPGDCLMFPLEPSKERHFAMFPTTLPEFCIKAGCPKEVCKKCGTPKLSLRIGGSPYSFNLRIRDAKEGRIKNSDRKASNKEIKEYNEKDYISKERRKIVFSCDCNAGFEPGIVLDPFMGSGTTAIVAKRLNRNFIGFELNKDYVKIARRRLKNEN